MTIIRRDAEAVTPGMTARQAQLRELVAHNDGRPIVIVQERPEAVDSTTDRNAMVAILAAAVVIGLIVVLAFVAWFVTPAPPPPPVIHKDMPSCLFLC